MSISMASLPLASHHKRSCPPLSSGFPRRPPSPSCAFNHLSRLRCPASAIGYIPTKSGVWQYKMTDSTFLDRMLSHLRKTCKYHTGYPKDLGPSRVIHFTSEREFVQLLQEGQPVVVAFTIKSNYTKHLDKVLEEAAAEFYPHVRVLRVECTKYPGFCISRQRKEYLFVEIFHSPEQASNQARVGDPNVTRYSVKVLPFNYDLSAYGFREFFKCRGIQGNISGVEIL